MTWAQVAKAPKVNISDLPQSFQVKVKQAAEKLALPKPRALPTSRKRKPKELSALYFTGSLRYNPLELKSILWDSLLEYSVYFVDVLGAGDVELIVDKDRAEIVEGVMRAPQFQRAMCDSALRELRSDTDPPKNDNERKSREQDRAIRCLRRIHRIVKKIRTFKVVDFYNHLSSQAREVLLLSGLSWEQVDEALDGKWFPRRSWRAKTRQGTRQKTQDVPPEEDTAERPRQHRETNQEGEWKVGKGSERKQKERN